MKIHHVHHSRKRRILKAVDNKTDTTYTGIAGDEAEVLMQFNRKQIISGLKYNSKRGNKLNPKTL